VDSTHNSLVTVGNGGDKPARAQLTILYNQGSGQYQVEQMLAPDEQMWLDFGNLIHDQVPDKDGHILPPDLASGTYRIRDLSDRAAGGLYEGKVTLDKTYGHAAYGCAICCGYEDVFMEFNPLAVAVNGYEDQEVEAGDSCGGGTENITGDFPTWWTGNTAIATASGHQINGVATGTTPHYAQSVEMYWGPKEYYPSCPLTQQQPSGTINVCPSSSSVGSTTAESLAKVLATYKTGLGAVVGIQFNPAAPTGLVVTETLSSGATTCPQGFPTVCATKGNLNTASLVVGTAGTATDGTPFPATPNTMWDEHVVASASSLLGSSGKQCSIQCNQQYSCGGTIIGNYTITYTLSTGTISGTPVTNVTATVN
jgi:hypothetical protein